MSVHPVRETSSREPSDQMSGHPIMVAVSELQESLKAVSGVNPIFMETPDKAAALLALAEVEAQVGELKLRILAEAGDVAQAAGARSASTWLAHATRARRGDASADLRLASALEHLPTLAAGLREGRVNVAQAHVIERAINDLPSEASAEIVALAEEALVAHAADFDPTDLSRLGRRILDVVAPEIAEAAEAKALADLEAHSQERMRFGVRSAGNGLTRISGLLPDADAARLVTFLHAFTNPRAQGGAVAGAEAAGEETSREALRVPYARRAAQAFCQLLETLDPQRLPLHGGDATTLVVTVTLDALRSELATATLLSTAPGDSLETITAAQARRLACTARIIPAVLGSDSEVLDLGRSQRLFSQAQRRALLLRDKNCRAEGCRIPGTWSEAHHLTPWSHGGSTDLDDAALLCRHHHQRIHDAGYTMLHLPSGEIRFRRQT